MRRQLTDISVRKIAPPAVGRIEVFDVLVPWLAVRITSNGARSYVVRARIHGQQRPVRITLGNVGLYSLQQAREKARETLLAMKAGVDPREETKRQERATEARKRLAFDKVAGEYIKEHVSRLRTAARTGRDIERYLVGAWGERPIDAIAADDVAEVIREIASRYPQMANRVLVSAKHLFKWAASPARPRAERLPHNPTADLTMRDFGIRPARRQTVLSHDLLRQVWTCSAQLPDPWPAFFRMLLLSGQRRGEIAGLRWDEVNLNEGVIVFPPERMKSGRPHELPLTATMQELLEAMPQSGAYVFPNPAGSRPLSAFDRMKRRLDTHIRAEMPEMPGWHLHDVRRTVRSNLSALPQVQQNVRELVVAHIPPGLLQTYDVHDYRAEKLEALTLWGERLARMVDPPEGNVTPLRRAGL